MKNTSSSYPYFVAEFIESSEFGSMRDAILFITKEDLKDLRTQMQPIALKVIMIEVEKKEEYLMKVFSKLLGESGKDGYILMKTNEKKEKELLTSLKEELVYLYTKRRGLSEGDRLSELIEAVEPSPHEFVIEFDTDKNGKKFIKSMMLRSLKAVEESPDDKTSNIHNNNIT